MFPILARCLTQYDTNAEPLTVIKGKNSFLETNAVESGSESKEE